MTTQKPQMLTPKQWGKLHGVAPSTVLSWIKKGWIPGVIKTELPSGGWNYSIPADAPRPNTKPGPKPIANPLVLKELSKYGGDKLTEDERETIAQNHADHFFDLAKKAHQKLFGSEQNTWLDRLDYEYDNLRAALTYYHGKESAAMQELEMAVLLGRFWDARGHWQEGIDTLQRTLARQGPGNSPLKAWGLAWIGLLSLSQDDYEQAKQALSESIRMSRILPDPGALSLALHSLGVVTEAQGNYTEARSLFLESIEWGEKAHLDWLVGWNYRWLGTAAEAERNYTSAKSFYLKYLSTSEKIEHVGGIAGALDNLGVIARHEGHYPEARKYHEQSLALRRGLGNKLGMSYCYFNIGLVEEAMNQHQEACLSFQKGLALCKEVGDRRGVARAMEGIGRMAVAMNKEQEAARIFGAADALRTLIAAPLSPAEQQQYGHLILSAKERFRSEWNKGKRQDTDEGIQCALSFNIAQI